MEALGPVRLKDVDAGAKCAWSTSPRISPTRVEIMIASKQGEDELIY